jgi:hypothetical protein
MHLRVELQYNYCIYKIGHVLKKTNGREKATIPLIKNFQTHLVENFRVRK